jgi:hypothetical protein
MGRIPHAALSHPIEHDAIGAERRAGEHTPIVFYINLTTSAIIRSVPGTTPTDQLLSQSQTQRRLSMTSRRAPRPRVRVIVGSQFDTSRHSLILRYGRASQMRKMCGDGYLSPRVQHLILSRRASSPYIGICLTGSQVMRGSTPT